MLATYGMNLGGGRYLPVKNVFVPLWVNGRRWGNFELAIGTRPSADQQRAPLLRHDEPTRI
jgi:hypothetical protein